jgi:assimilatory nitrate reductase catalytic subunit
VGGNQLLLARAEALMDEIRTTCPYCGVGCGVLARREENGLVSVRGDEQHPANLGRLCVKGAALGETTGLEGRLLRPELEGSRSAGHRR